MVFLFKLDRDQILLYCTFSFLPTRCGFSAVTNDTERKRQRENESSFALRADVAERSMGRGAGPGPGFLSESRTLSDHLL